MERRMAVAILALVVTAGSMCIHAATGSASQQQSTVNASDGEIARSVAMLGDPSAEGEKASEELIRAGADAMPALVDFLQQPPPVRGRQISDAQRARVRAAYVLLQLHYEQIDPLLRREITLDPDPAVRLLYESYLAQYNMLEGVTVLIQELERGEAPSERVVVALKDVSNIREIEYKTIGLIRPLLEDSRSDIRIAAAEMLCFFDDWTAEPVLLSALGTKDELRAALILRDRYAELVIPVLHKYVNDPDESVRVSVAERLAALGNPDGFEVLLDALKKEPNPELRGGDDALQYAKGPAQSLIRLIGTPDTYDPFGTKDERNLVIERWRTHWKSEGRAFLHGLQARQPEEGLQEANLGDIHLSSTMADMQKPYFLAGEKLNVLGAMDGTYPPLGRLLGDQSGIWTQPAKVMDGIEYAILEGTEQPWLLTGSRHFVNDFYAVHFFFARKELEIERQDVVAELEPVLFSHLTIRNVSGQPRSLRLRVTGYVNIRPSWRSGLPSGPDVLEYKEGLVRAFDEAQAKWAVAFGADRQPISGVTEENRGVLIYDLRVPAGGAATITVVIAADKQGGVDSAVALFKNSAGAFERGLASRASYYEQWVFGGVSFESSDRLVRDAFYLAKANLLMLTTDNRPYLPAPYFSAGIPIYPQLFSNDSDYSIPGAVAGGFRDTGHGALEDLALYAEKQHGWVPHEITTNGRFLGPGNRQETPQFVMTVWNYFEWTGDIAFLKRMYPLCKQGLDYMLGHFDRNGNGYLEGPGLIEINGMGTEKVDAAAYLYGAYKTLSVMAQALGEQRDSLRYSHYAAQFRTRFNHDWWDSEAQMWADSLDNEGHRRLDGYWSVVFPMESGVADPDKAYIALHRIQERWVNQWGGVHTNRPDITDQGSGVVTSNVFALTAFRYGLSEFGWRMLRLAALAPRERGELGAFAETVPLGGSDLMQLWSSGPYLAAVIEGLAGIHPDAGSNAVEILAQMPNGVDGFKLGKVVVGAHVLDLEQKREEDTLLTIIRHVSGTGPLRCSLKWVPRTGQIVTVNGLRDTIGTQFSSTLGRSLSMVDRILRPGEMLRVAVR